MISLKHILLFGAGKSSAYLIDFLISQCVVNNWRVTVADSDLPAIQSKLHNTSHAVAYQLDAGNTEQRVALVKEADLVISLLPPALHFIIAEDCLQYGKTLLTASYLDGKMEGLARKVKDKGILFLLEMGLDPGIDHMSALQLINRVRNLGGNIFSFKSHCGGLVAPSSDDNPFHYKISWNPHNVVMAGSSGAFYKENNRVFQVRYEELFNECKQIEIQGLGNLAYYPNRDSLAYMKIYGLEDAETFIRTTLRHPAFCKAWKSIVSAGLTNDTFTVDFSTTTFKNWSKAITPLVNSENEEQLDFLGLFQDEYIPVHLKTSAAVLQFLMETRMMMRHEDKDMVVMAHEVEFILDGTKRKITSSLSVTGEDHRYSAMAKTVGLPLGIAAKLILDGTIRLSGLQIPVVPEIYEPVLKELARNGIMFEEKTT